MGGTVKCKYCGGVFSTLLKLRAHINRSTCKIFNNLSFSCDICKFRTKNLREIEDHILSHINKDSQLDALKKRIKELERQLENQVDNEKKEEIKSDSEVEQEVSPEPKKKKTVYKTVKNQIDLVDESDLARNFDEVSQALENENKNLWNTSQSECLNYINSKVNGLKTTRNYTKLLSDIKDQRLFLLKFFSLEEYCGYLHSHINEIKDILKSKKIDLLIKTKILLPLEMRLLFWNSFENTTLEVEEINIFKSSLNFKHGVSKLFNTFNREAYLKEFLNYNIAMFSMKENIEIFTVNKFGINNVIYLPITRSTKEDPYSFYYLEKICGDNRNWRMDCRLEELVTDFVDIVLGYCINLYRKLYHIIFRDNNYRSDIKIYNSLLECECQQLVENIILLSSPSKIFKLFKDIIVEKCSYTPSRLDKFNLYSDDMLQKKQFTKLISQDENKLNITKLGELFDDATTEQTEEFLKKFNTVNFK